MAGGVAVTSDSKRDVLFSLMGMSPAVLTETVWVLAHEDPPVIPESIYVLTTLMGKEAIERSLFDSGVWSHLLEVLQREKLPISGRLKFGAAADHIRLFPMPGGAGNLRDIVSSIDSEFAADFIMRKLREFTENPETRVIASIAGGRKSMAALMTSCMSLLGRRQDRLCHVLVNPPYDNPRLGPRFFFPEKGVKHYLPGENKTYLSKRARLELTDIPFVRVRGWYEGKYSQAPPSFMALVRRVQGVAPPPANYPRVHLDLKTGGLKVDDRILILGATEFAVFSALMQFMANGGQLTSWADLQDYLDRLTNMSGIPPKTTWLHDFQNHGDFNAKDDARNPANRIRKKLARLLGNREQAELLVPNLRKNTPRTYPAGKIKIVPLT